MNRFSCEFSSDNITNIEPLKHGGINVEYKNSWGKYKTIKLPTQINSPCERLNKNTIKYLTIHQKDHHRGIVVPIQISINGDNTSLKIDYEMIVEEFKDKISKNKRWFGLKPSEYEETIWKLESAKAKFLALSAASLTGKVKKRIF
jgi:hypothetical protein